MSRRQLANAIDAARNIVIFTGAGISTESGVPDFRSPGGVWSRMKPIYFQEFVSDEERRREAWSRVFSGAARWTGAAPNDGHTAVARLIAEGRASAVITQNVDNLHQQSGIPDSQIIELHGNAHYARCLACALRHEFEEFRESFLEHAQIPVCRACGGLVKSATISFGQSMPEEPMERAEAATLDCDLFLVLGSSLVVYPAAGFPLMAKQNGAMLAIVNREATDQDPHADIVLHDEIGPALSEIVGA